MKLFRTLVSLLVTLAAGLTLAEEAKGVVVVPVSPGAPETTTTVAGPCPPFDWSSVGEPESIELAVYRMPDPGKDGSAPEPEELYWLILPGSARGWTPSLDRCLQPGGRYAWALRAVTSDGLGEWSPVYFFQIPQPTAIDVQRALAVIEAFLGTERGEPSDGAVQDVGESPGSVERSSARTHRRDERVSSLWSNGAGA